MYYVTGRLYLQKTKTDYFKCMKKTIFLITLIFIQISSIAQSQRIDSLKSLLDTAKDKDKAEILNQLCEIYTDINPDTTLIYGKQAYNLSLHGSDTSTILSAANNIITAYNQLNKLDSAMAFAVPLLEKFEKNNNKVYYIVFATNIAEILRSKSFHDKAIFFLNSALKYATGKLEVYRMSIYDRMAAILYEKRSYKKALTYCDSFFYYYKKYQNTYNIPPEYYQRNLNTKFSSLMHLGKLDQDKAVLQDLIKFSQQNHLTLPSFVYYQIGTFYQKIGKNDSAIFYYDTAFSLANKSNNLKLATSILEDELGVLQNTGQYEKAIKISKKLHDLTIKLYDEQKTSIILDLTQKYQDLKKQKEIEKQKMLLQRAREEQKFYLVTIILLTISVFATALYIIQTRKKNKALKEYAEKIELQKNEKQMQSEELYVANEMLEYQSKKLKDSLQKLTDNMQYSSRILKASMPDKQLYKTTFQDYFIIYKPLEKIGGDFHFLKVKEDKIFWIIGDGASHGVSGALNSILGLSLINEIINYKDIDDPAEILNLLRLKIKNIVKSDAGITMSSVGLDMGIVIFNKDLNSLKYAGSNIPLFIVSNNNLSYIKPSRQPLGFYLNEQEFKSVEIKINKGDKLYMTTDGFIDQLNKQHRRFTITAFKRLLLSVSSLPMAQQKQKILETYHEWTQSTKQMDDILVIGVQV